MLEHPERTFSFACELITISSYRWQQNCQSSGNHTTLKHGKRPASGSVRHYAPSLPDFNLPHSAYPLPD
ncbi:MAG: hypothetical protein N6V49_07935, partial [Serratia symbiotica]|nr:hypothetical protein [Serratia symbiotica]